MPEKIQPLPDQFQEWHSQGQNGTSAPNSITPDCIKIMVGASTCGLAAGAEATYHAIQEKAKELGLDLIISRTGCIGYCQEEPILDVLMPNRPRVTYRKITSDKVENLLQALKKDQLPSESALFQIPSEKILIEDTLCIYGTKDGLDGIAFKEEHPFFAKQKRVALRNCGVINPRDIKEYIGRGGYKALIQVLSRMKPEAVIEEIKNSGLRGGGGGGFSTGEKWCICYSAKSDCKYLICNAAYLDRTILEGDPHSLIEGMLIGAYAVGAKQGYIYVRSEYHQAIEILQEAIYQARKAGFLGKNIQNSGLDFELKIKLGDGAFVCGEETSLIASLEGRSGEPNPKPPYPAECGLWGKPTLVNNAKVWAMISPIIVHGAEWFKDLGHNGYAGTMVFSLLGKVVNRGLLEVPLGTTIGEMIFDIGGGISSGRKFKAVQIGGPTGGCLPQSQLDLSLSYDQLEEAGSMMGACSLTVLDENDCMVEVARNSLKFAAEESCGKCTPCREGTRIMAQILEDICAGKGNPEDLDTLEKLAWGIKHTSLCGHGKEAANPVLSTLRYFKNEYQEHIQEKYCQGFVCHELVGAPCASACPVGTEPWRYIAHIAREEYEQAYLAIREPNPFPSVCARVCNHPCESKCRAGTTGGEAIAIRDLKRFVTDRIEPSIYKPERIFKPERETKKVAIVGAGPAGLSAAHLLSLKGYKVTVFEAENKPGGMLVCGIPAYRLPRETLQKEIDTILDANVTLKCNLALGSDFTIDSLFKDGYEVIFLALGAHKSQKLKIEGEESEGVYPSIQFLKAYNLHGVELAYGKVGVVGGGNSALDAARVALRQKKVDSVTIIYRRTRQEMPAFEEEIKAALEEGIKLETLVSPARVKVKDGKLIGLEITRNTLGKFDASGRRRPVPIEGSQEIIPLDTLIVAISESPETDSLAVAKIELSKWGSIIVDPKNLTTNRAGVFAGGDVVTGPNTVIEAIADGKKVAILIDKYLKGEELVHSEESRMPKIYIEPIVIGEDELDGVSRARAEHLPLEERKNNFLEVEKTLSIQKACLETKRCLRCDLEFTTPKKVP